MGDGDDPFSVDRIRRLTARLDGRTVSEDGPGPAVATERLDRICAVTADVAGVDGAGITIMGSTEAGLSGHRDQIAAAGPLTRRLEDLQLTAGEGPCLDAFRDGMPVLAADLAAEYGRWIGFAPAAVTAGAAAVFSLPLQVGAIRIGTLDLHRATVGGLSSEQLADALTMASLATEALLDLAGPDGPTPGSPAGWLPDVHADVHIASGMVSALNGVDVRSALLRIRAHAFARDEPIHQVARRIIDRDLVLDDSDDPVDPDAPDDNGSKSGPSTPHEEGPP